MITIRDRMRLRGWNISELCRQSGIPQATISDILSGKTPLLSCSVETVVKLSNAFNTTVDEFLQNALKYKNLLDFRNGVINEMNAYRRPMFFVSKTLRDGRVAQLLKEKKEGEACYLSSLLDHYIISYHFELPDENREARSIYFIGDLRFAEDTSEGFKKANIYETDASLSKEISLKEFTRINSGVMA